MKSFVFIQKHIKSYLKIKPHLKNKLCSPIPSPTPSGPPLPASPASLTPVSGFALNGPSAAPLLSPKVNPLKSLPQPGTRGVVLSLPGRRGGGQERASSKKGVSGKEEGGREEGKRREYSSFFLVVFGLILIVKVVSFISVSLSCQFYY